MSYTYLRLYSRIGHRKIEWTLNGFSVYHYVFSPRFWGLPFLSISREIHLETSDWDKPYDLNISFIHLELPVTFSILCVRKLAASHGCAQTTGGDPSPTYPIRVPRVIDRTWHDLCAFRTPPLLGGSVLASALSGFRPHNISQLMVLHPFDEMIVSISASQRMPYILKLFEGSLLVPVLKMWQVNLGDLGAWLGNPGGPVLGHCAWEPSLGTLLGH